MDQHTPVLKSSEVQSKLPSSDSNSHSSCSSCINSATDLDGCNKQ
jgi:hypothetical protein